MTTRLEKEKKRYEREKNNRFKSIRWDKKSTIILLSVIIFIISSFIALNVDFKGFYIKNNSNWDTTCGKIIDIKPHTNMDQTKMGNMMVTVGYIVTYEYEIDKVIYSGTKYLSSRAIKNKLFIHGTYEGDIRKIFYNKMDPEESHIEIDLESVCE